MVAHSLGIAVTPRSVRRSTLCLMLLLAACSSDPTANERDALLPGADADTGLSLDDADDADATTDAQLLDITDAATDDASSDSGAEDTVEADAQRDANADAMSDASSPDTASDSSDADIADAVEDGTGDADEPDPPVLHLSGPDASVVVGDRFTVRCAALLDGRAASGVPTIIEAAGESTVSRQDDGTWLATAVGTAEFVCRDARSVLADSAPLRMHVLAGAPSRVRASVSATAIVAGEPLVVRCVGEDSSGAELGELAGRVVARTGDGAVEVVGNASLEDALQPLALERATTHQVSCQLDAVPESEPVEVRVTPAPAARVRVVPDALELRAGEWGTAGCVGEDQYGNVIGVLEEANLYVVPSPLVTREAQSEPEAVRAFQVVGNPYEVRCEGDRLQSTNAGRMTVTPDSPSRLVGEFLSNGQRIDGTPQVVPPGSFVAPSYRIYDRYLNLIEPRGLDSQIVTSIHPDAPRLANGWLLEDTGQYDFTVQWRGASSASVNDVQYVLNVDSGGPLLSCVSPADAEWIIGTPGTTTPVTVGASDDADVQDVEVNGEPARALGDGLYEADIVLSPGVNLLDIRATDTLGQEGAVTCGFLAAPAYRAVEERIDDGMTIIMGEDAFDDGSRSGAVNSMADLVAAALSSDTVVDELDAALDDVDPLWSGNVPIPFGSVGGRVEYRGGVSIGSRSSASITIDGNRLQVPITLRDVSVPVRVVVTGPFGGSDNGTVTASTISTSASVSLRRSGDRLDGTLESLSAINISSLDGSFGSSITNTGWDLAEPTVRDELEDQLGDALEPALSDLVDDMFRAFGGFEASIELTAPSIDDGPSVPVLFDFSLSTARLAEPVLTLGLNTTFAVPEAAVIRDGALVPLLDTDADLPDVNGIGVYVSLDLVNQGMVALWSAGLFDTTLFDFAAVLDVVPGTEITTFTIRPDLPPIASVRDGELVLSFGSVFSDLLDIFYGPGVIDGRVGADVAGTPVLNPDGSLAFTNVRVLRSAMSLQPANYTRSDYERVLDGLINARIETVATDAMDAALPGTALPSIEGSAALAPFGLGPGQSLTLVEPSVVLLEHGLLFVGDLGRVE